MENFYVKSARAQIVNEDTPISLGMNRVKEGKYYEFSATLDGELADGQKILFCHGHMASYGRWMEITNTEIKICSYVPWAEVPSKEYVFTHGLTVKGHVNLNVAYDTANSKKEIILSTDGGEYKMGAGHWSCCDGELCVKVEGVALKDAFLGFNSLGYSHDIWIIGASYLSLGDPARWPYYWFAEGGAGPLLVGRGGMGAQHGIEDFKDALNYGAPKILVWDSVSGNNPDKEGVLNPLFYDNTLEMLRICKEKGIKVYIQTMPNCPLQTNMIKNDVILNRTLDFANYDYEIIDLARALNARDEENPAWFPNMLHTDNVHPTRLGGRASYLGIVVDAPELILGKPVDIYRADAKELKSGEEVVLSASTEVKSVSAITLRADFADELYGEIILGSKGGSYLALDKDNIKVYSESGELLLTAENPAIMNKLFNLKVKVSDGKAAIVLASSGEKNFDATKTTLDVFEAEWKIGGEIFAKANGQSLNDVVVRFATVD